MYFTFNNQTFTSNELSSNLVDIKKSFQIGGKTDTIKNITDILKHFSFFQIQAFAKSYCEQEYEHEEQTIGVWMGIDMGCDCS